jgi:hypothetical protein
MREGAQRCRGRGASGLLVCKGLQTAASPSVLWEVRTDLLPMNEPKGEPRLEQ